MGNTYEVLAIYVGCITGIYFVGMSFIGRIDPRTDLNLFFRPRNHILSNE